MEKVITCSICASTNVRKFCVKRGYTIYRCMDCSLAFVWPIPQDAAVLYSEAYFQGKGNDHGYLNYDRDKEPMRKVFLHYLSVLGKATSGRRLFDVGAATGYFLDIARHTGWTTYGSDISPFAAREARARGHRMTGGNLREAAESDFFDVVTMWDVLEHVPNPRATLAEVHRLLRIGGVVAINTVDMSSLWARLLGRRWNMLIPPEPLFYFSTANLSLLLTQTGFQVMEKRKIGKKFSLAYVCKTLYNWQKIPLWETLAGLVARKPFSRLTLPINVRDNVFVLAKKT